VGLLPLVVLLGAWQLLAPARSAFLPPPSTWWDALTWLAGAGTLFPAIRATAETFALALAVTIAAGSVVGLAIGASRRALRAGGPLLEFLRAMPPPAVVPAAALLLGFGRTMAVVVVVFAAMWPIALNTAAAVRALHPILLDSARALHLAPAARVRKVYAPALVPGLLLGVRVAAPVCLIVTLLVEMLTGATGVGALLLQAQRNFVSEQAFGLLIVVGVLGFAVNAGVRLVERSVLTRWPPRAGSR
jgi:ABC-type nitrate/sulfonate/bicarbonate transport system permease component